MLDAAHNELAVPVARLKIPTKVRSHLQSAHEELGKKNRERAAAEADRALRIDLQCAPALSMKPFIDLAARNPIAGGSTCNRGKADRPVCVRAFVSVAMAQNANGAFSESQQAGPYGQGQWDEALAELDTIDKDFPDVHLLKANVFMRLGRRQEGTAEFARFLDEAPHDRRVERSKRIIAETRGSQPNLYL